MGEGSVDRNLLRGNIEGRGILAKLHNGIRADRAQLISCHLGDDSIPRIRNLDVEDDQISKVGGVSLTWLSRILAKTGLCKDRHASPRLQPSAEESLEEP